MFRVFLCGKGADDPAYSNATSEGRAQNRRVDIHVGVKSQPTD
jgi:flagellar motor protein MotB